MQDADLTSDPDAGTVGYLTYDEFDRLTRAWVTAIKHLPWWWVAGHIRGGDSDELRTRSTEHTLPLPSTWLAAHEITRLMQELNQWPELEDAAHDDYGSEIAKLLTSEVQTAAAKWPISDRAHRVQHFRCQACQQLTLKYMPPTDRAPHDAPRVIVQQRIADGAVRDRPTRTSPATVEVGSIADVVVRCTDKECGAVMDSQMFELAVSVIRQEWELRNAKRRLAAS